MAQHFEEQNPSSDAAEKSSGETWPCRSGCCCLARNLLMIVQVSLILCFCLLEPQITQSDHAIFSCRRLWVYQILAAGHCCLALLFTYLWKEVDSSSSILVSELQIYIMTGWSYWLLGATYELSLRQDLPATVQIIVLTCHRMNCALLEFNFTYLLQCRLALLQKGLGCNMGVSKVRWIRWVFLLLQLSLDLFRAHVQSQSQLAIDCWSAAYHLVAAIGVLCTLALCLRALASVTSILQGLELPGKSFAKLERDWSLQVLTRMTRATVFSCILCSASHVIVIPAVILVHGMLRPLLVPAYHFLDIATELIGLAFIVGILRPEMPGIKPENPSSMRGASQLQGETSSESATWKAKVEELAHRSIDLESLLDFYEKLGSDVMKHFNPQVSTTADVVRQAVIPLSQVGTGGVAYADYLVMTGKPSRQTPDCMVTHTWSSLFLDLVAAVVSDALELDEYHQIATRIREGKLDNLRQKLASKGALQNRYWICCFCVNQHASICNGVGEAPADPVALARWERNRRDSATGQVVRFCRCSEPKVLNDQPDHCELNKFQVMMLWLHRENPNFRQLVAVDCDFTVFERAWCVAELGAAYDADIPQHICLYSNQPFEFEDEDLSVYTKLTNLSVANSFATRPEDKAMVLDTISSIEDFDAELQYLIFGNRGLLKQKFMGFDSLVPAARTVRRLCTVQGTPLRGP